MTARLILGTFCAAAALAALSTPVAAQQVTQQAPAARGAGIEEIVVTARRREENIQSVPVAVTAISALQIEERSITSAQDIQYFVPALEIHQYTKFSGSSTVGTLVGLRGVPGARAYFAEAPSGLSTATDYFDLQSFQALAGPQGTLFGLSATGGAVVVEPKRPTDRYEGYLRAQLGQLNDRKIEGALNVPIVADKLMVRIAAQREVRDGYTRDILTGVDSDNIDYWSWRVGMTVKPTDRIENYLLYRGSYRHEHGNARVLLGVNPTGLVASIYGNAFVQGVVQAQQARGLRRIAGQNFDPIQVRDPWTITDILRWDVSDNMSVKAIGSYDRTGRGYGRSDDDGSIINSSGNATFRGTDTETYTGELQLSGRVLDNRLNWQAGYFVAYSQPTAATRDYISPGTQFVFGSRGNATGNVTLTRTNAIFGQATYDLGGLSSALDGVSFTAGYRYNWDYKSVDSYSRSTTNGQCSQAGSDANCRINRSGKWKAPGWTFALDYQINPQTLVYVTSRRAYSQGDFSLTLPVEFSIVKPEYVTDVEVGVKSDWELGGMHGRTNLAIFNMWYQDIVKNNGLVFTDAAGRTVFTNSRINAAKAQIFGWELGATLIPVEDLEISANLGFLAPHYTSYVQNIAGGGTIDRTGETFVGVPKDKWSLGIKYYLPVEESAGQVSLSATAFGKVGEMTAVDNQPFARIKGWYNLNLRADWRDVLGYPLDLSIWCNNVNDKQHVETGNTGGWYTIGLTALSFSAPRLWGASLTYRFNS